MADIRIGIIKEGKVPIDKRVPFTPEQALELQEKFKNVHVVVQASDIRAYKDEEYEQFGIEVRSDVSDCDILMGVKEVPIDELIDGKTYFFFSHTTKEQPYNKNLLQSIIKKNIRIIDYEALTNTEGTRVVAFGRYAGLVGAYNAILTYGKRYNLFDLRPAHECFDLADLKSEFDKITLPKIKIALTGGGRVSKGAMEVLLAMGIRKVSPAKFLAERYDQAVFTQLNSRDYHVSRDNSPFNRSLFYQSPEKYDSSFLQYARVADLLISGGFWDPKAPVLFTRQDIMKPDFNIRVVADITCDIEGSIPSTKMPSTIDDPIYDYNPSEDKVEAPFKDEANVSVMAVDNLPCELPRDASKDFGRELIDNVIPHLVGNDNDNMILDATIAKDGELTNKYKYLTDYIS